MFLIYFESQQQQVQQENKRRNKRKSLQQSILLFSLAQTFASAGSRHLHYGKLCGWATEYIASLYTLVYIGAIAAAVGQRVLDIFCAVLLLFVG
jgi:cbb3-type cytochrome oxidase subunit 1